MSTRRSIASLLAGLLTVVAVACGGSGESGSAGAERSTTTVDDTASTETAPTETSELAMDVRSRLTRRLGEELRDPDAAERAVAAMDDGAIAAAERIADGDIAGSPWLAYRPSTVPAGEVDSLWVFSYGYRLADGSGGGVAAGAPVPPMDALEPGPTNEALARSAAAFVKEHPVPVVAQWEVARVLEDLGVRDVIPVEPDVAADGTVTYLSTVGVAQKGLTALRSRGGEPGHAGVLCFRDHAVRCELTMRSIGLTADVPAGIELPDDYDPESGQEWTRSVESWIPIDLAGRAALEG